MRYPKQLQQGQTIGLVAPSFGATIEPYATALDSAKEAFGVKGFACHEYDCVRKSDGFGISSTPSACGYEINASWIDPSTSVLLSCGGGELMCEAISHVDFDLLRKAEPKWFMGYSDNTNLVHLLVTLADTAAIYGPCAPAFGMQPWHESLYDAFDILTGQGTDSSTTSNFSVQSYGEWQLESLKDEEHPLEPYNIDTPQEMHAYAYKDGFGQVSDLTFEGRLIGGCVDCLSNVVGTKFDKTAEFVKKTSEGVVWMLETCELSPMDLRRSLWQMYMAGWFENTRGFIFGRPERYGETSFGKGYEEIVLDFFTEFNIHIPCIFEADFGHKPPMMPIIMGSVGNCHFHDNELSITMNLA